MSDTNDTSGTGTERSCGCCGTPIPDGRPADWDNQCPNPHCESRIRTDGGQEWGDTRRLLACLDPSCGGLLKLVDTGSTNYERPDGVSVVGAEYRDYECRECGAEARQTEWGESA